MAGQPEAAGVSLARLACGCVVLWDQDGPCGVIEPCKDYPPDGNGNCLRGVENWQSRLAGDRERSKKYKAAKAKRQGGRKKKVRAA